MFSDVPEGMPLAVGDNISLVVGFKDREDLKNVFEKLRTGGAVRMDLQETFWTKCYGYVVDKFGVGWQLSLET
jgi:PhnB protein